MESTYEATMRLACAVGKLADAINRHCDLMEPNPRKIYPAVVSVATYDRKISQAEKELKEKFSPGQTAAP